MTSFYPLAFWGAVPLLILNLKGWHRSQRVLSLFFLGLPLFWVVTKKIPTTEGLLQVIFFLFLTLALLMISRIQKRIGARSGINFRGLRQDQLHLEKEKNSLRKRFNHCLKSLENLQNRFTLVQVAATKMEAANILTTLGKTWVNKRGVGACLLMERNPNGNWHPAFSHNVSSPGAWSRFLAENPGLAHSRHVRRYTTPEKHPLLAKMNKHFRPPFLLVPFSWDRDVLALAYVEVRSLLAEDITTELTAETRIVSLGLRRSYLYHLMKERSRVDPLTNAFLRRVLQETLRKSVKKSQRYKTPLFCALIDIDHFKSINDRWGHLAGDRVLVHLTDTIRKHATPDVFLARYGGDEFALLLEMESEKKVLKWLDLIRTKVANAVVSTETPDLRYTLSIGVASYWPGKPTPRDFLVHADKALYQAKKKGRNRVAAYKKKAGGR